MRLRDSLRPTLKADQVNHYTPTLNRIAADISAHRGTISALVVYPIKSLGGIHVEQAILGSTGLRTKGGLRDRSAMLVQWNEDKQRWKRFTQRDEPALAAVEAHASDNGALLLRHSAGAIAVKNEALIPHRGEVVRAATYDDESVEGILEPDTNRITMFVREFLAMRCRYARKKLEAIRVLLPSSHKERLVPQSHSGDIEAATEFADVSKYLLVNQGTVDYVNGHIDPAVDTAAFRPNIVVAGWPANMEDIASGAQLSNGHKEINFSFGVPSTRCAVTGVDQTTGIKRTDGQPNKALMHLRPLREKKPTMGINVADGLSGLFQEIHVGDSIVPTG